MKKNISFGVLCLFVILFAPPVISRPEDESTREKFPSLRSAYIGDNCRVEIISTVSIDETETKKEKSPVYVYEYVFINRGETRARLSFMNPPHLRLALGPGEERKEKFRAKEKPKIFSVRVAIGIWTDYKWSFDGLNISIIYVPDIQNAPSARSYLKNVS